MIIRAVSRYEDTPKDSFWIRQKSTKMLFYGDYCRNNNNNNIMNVRKKRPVGGVGVGGGWNMATGLGGASK